MIKVKKLRAFPFLTNDEILQFGSNPSFNESGGTGFQHGDDSEVLRGCAERSYRFEVHD